MELGTNLKEARKRYSKAYSYYIWQCGVRRVEEYRLQGGKKAKHKAKEILLVGAVAF